MISARMLAELFDSAGFQNSQEMAETLLSRFHTIDGVLSADPDNLCATVGEGAAVLLKLSAALVSRRVYDGFALGKKHTEAEIKKLLVAMFRGCSVETLYLVSLDENGAALSCDLMSEGTINATSVLPRQLLDRAVKNRAASVIIAHNHPAGVATPSPDDASFTSTVRSVLGIAGIDLAAHYVVAGSVCAAVN